MMYYTVRRDFIFILSLAVRSTKTQAIPNDPTTEKERRDKGKRESEEKEMTGKISLGDTVPRGQHSSQRNVSQRRLAGAAPHGAVPQITKHK